MIQVEFVDISDQYSSQEDLVCKYQFNDYTPQEGDRVAIFKLGWTLVKEYLLFEWAPTDSNAKIHHVVFNSKCNFFKSHHNYLYLYYLLMIMHGFLVCKQNIFLLLRFINYVIPLFKSVMICANILFFITRETILSTITKVNTKFILIIFQKLNFIIYFKKVCTLEKLCRFNTYQFTKDYCNSLCNCLRIIK